MSKTCNPDSCSTIGVLQLKIDGLMQTIESQKETNIALASKVMDDHRFAELGRLMVNTKCSLDMEFDEEDCSMIAQCELVPACKLRAELLAEVQK